MFKQAFLLFPQNWLWLVVNVGALLRLVQLATFPVTWDVDIVRMQQSGKTALVLLTLSLACTPVASMVGATAVLKVRKSLGLWGFGFACLHAVIFLTSDAWIISDIWTKVQFARGKLPYAQVGLAALLLLLPLAVTSSRWAMRRLGRNWKRLHRLVYLALPLAVWHYWWGQSRNEQFPELRQPLLFATVVAVLLLVRIPPARKLLTGRLALARAIMFQLL